MQCSACAYDGMPPGARFCPNCGAKTLAPPETQIEVSQEVGAVQDGQVVGLQLGEVDGDLCIESTINQFETTFVRGNVVDQQNIYNVTLELGEGFLEELVKRLLAAGGVDKGAVSELGIQPLPEQLRDQITHVIAAQREAAASGMTVSPTALYGLGRLATHRRDYDDALDYFRRATQTDSGYSDAFEAIVELQLRQALQDVQVQDLDAAIGRLAEAQEAAKNTDPLDPDALVLRGYIAKTLAQVADARGDRGARVEYLNEAARYFEHVARLKPDDASAHNGLGNIQQALGQLDAAIASYRRAIQLAPRYASAHHDLASAFEGKMKADSEQAAEWCNEALQMWQKTYQLAPDDPAFSADDLLTIGQRISWLKRTCGQVS